LFGDTNAVNILYKSSQTQENFDQHESYKDTYFAMEYVLKVSITEEIVLRANN
jgi:hypothetical protein